MPLADINGTIEYSPASAAGFNETNFICSATAALALFDYLLTFSDEIEMVWQRPFTGASVIFMLNRYMCLVFIVPLGILIETRTFLSRYSLFSYAQPFCRNCNIYYVGHSIVFFALRAYAIWMFSRKILCLVLMAYVPALVLHLCSMLLVGVPANIGITCVLLRGIRQQIRNYAYTRIAVTSVNQSALVPVLFFAFDTLVLVLLLIKVKRGGGVSVASQGDTISTVLLRHGIVYFIGLTFANVMQFSFIRISHEPLHAGVVITFSSILVSRFMLQLRATSSAFLPPPAVHRSASFKRWSSIPREVIVGNLGEPLQPLLRDRLGEVESF
ncbi:hypothetical protein BDW22DRAFT_1432407 [Trametopsis cervina]|nr:hypothetical protein BDW22DRAFT_1432407 [Trametopsis cervina]